MHRSRAIVIIINTINRISTFHTFCLSFLVSFSFRQLALLAAALISKVVVVHASPPSRRRLAGGGAPRQNPVAPLTTVGPDKTGSSDFYSFEQGLPVSARFVWQHNPFPYQHPIDHTLNCISFLT
jgi:hypothetical protein